MSAFGGLAIIALHLSQNLQAWRHHFLSSSHVAHQPTVRRRIGEQEPLVFASRLRAKGDEVDGELLLTSVVMPKAAGGLSEYALTWGIPMLKGHPNSLNGS